MSFFLSYTATATPTLTPITNTIATTAKERGAKRNTVRITPVASFLHRHGVDPDPQPTPKRRRDQGGEGDAHPARHRHRPPQETEHLLLRLATGDARKSWVFTCSYVFSCYAGSKEFKCSYFFIV